MFDWVHAGVHCGQFKCWGRPLARYELGDRVTLHTARSRGAVPSENPEPRDYQIVFDEQSAVVVRDGVFVDWKDTPLDDLPALGNDGRAVDPESPRLACVVPASQRAICNEGP